MDIDNLTGLYNTYGRWKWQQFKDFENFIHTNTVDYKAVVINKGKSVQVVRSSEELRKFKLVY